MPNSPDGRPDALARARAAKLNALVADHWSGALPASGSEVFAGSFPDGATLRAGSAGWVLAGGDSRRRLGGALAWARQQAVTDLHVLVDDPLAAGVLARRSSAFSNPPTIWLVDGRSLRRARPAASPTFTALPPTAELFRPVLLAAGTEAVAEGGELLAEVAGLEVARVVAGDGDPAGARLEVGVGRFDREAFAMMNAGLPDSEALAKAVGIVAEIRQSGAPRHQLNQLVPERWIRSVVVATPSLVGAAHLESVESAVPRQNLKESVPATALGVDESGATIVVVCSSGVDLDLVPCAADDRLAHAPSARLVLVLRSADVVPVTEALAAALVEPADIVVVDAGWGSGH